MRSTRLLFGSLVFSAGLVIAAACGSGYETSAAATSSASSSSGAGGSAGGSSTTGAGGDLLGDAGSGCTQDGVACGDAGVCAGGVCCDATQACGAVCCGATEVCSFQQCVTPGVTCVDATDCPDGYYCEYALGEASDAGVPDASCMGGAAQSTGKCLPKPPDCAPGFVPQPGDPLTCLPDCEHKPPAGQFNPVLKYSWGDPNAPSTKDSVMMAPVVIELDDDDCNGVVDERDIPEIVFLTFTGGNYNGDGTLHAISVSNGVFVDKWAANAGLTSPNHPGRSIAAGNIDGLPGNEIVVCTTDGRVRAYTAQGAELWLSPPGTCFMPSLADMDQNGTVEVVVESQILDGATGQPVVPAFNPPNTANVVVSDVDGDGFLDVVTANRAYHHDGSLIVDTGLSAVYPAVGDLDKDGVPEIVASNKPSHELVVWHVDPAMPSGFSLLRQHVDINGPLSGTLCPAGSSGSTSGGGPPTVADFDGDGYPDVALAGGVGYAVFSGAKLMDPMVADAQTNLWIQQTQDCSSAATGSSVFDFDGDGKAEVVYGDETTLHVYAGLDGAKVFETCNTNGTLFEYPLVADVDNDGQADIVVVSNSYSSFNCNGTKTAGVRVFTNLLGEWVRTRRIWNQHGYHVTNVLEDGTIPQIEPANYVDPKLDNFRQNIQPLGEFSAPDLMVTVAPDCLGTYGLVARVYNLGSASAPAGVPVGFYAGDPAQGGSLLGTVPTTHILYSAESEDVTLELASPPPGVTDGTTPVYAVVDDGMPMHTWHECRPDNNVSAPASGACSTPH